MKILLAPDKFKGSLSANEVAETLKTALQKTNPHYEFLSLPLADGGDGTLQVLKNKNNYNQVWVNTLDPLNRPISAPYLTNGEEAIIELAEASGITKLKKEELDVLKTTTTGTGILIKHALNQGHKQIILALGGSCTTEMGLGILKELGFQFLNAQKENLIPNGRNLLDIVSVIKNEIGMELSILCDVDNPLYGQQGAAHVFAKQKGASDKEVIFLDNGLRHISNLIEKDFKVDISDLRGGGAAGGIAAGLKGLLSNVKLISGFDYIAEKLSLEENIQKVDYVISGEGSLDETSLHGKTILRLSNLCRIHKKPLIIVAGSCTLNDKTLAEAGIHKVYSIMNLAHSLDDAIANAKAYLADLEIKL